MKSPPYLPLLQALAAGPRTPTEVAEATGRAVASVRASLSAMAATAGRAREAMVAVVHGPTRYSLTYAGAEVVRRAEEGAT